MKMTGAQILLEMLKVHEVRHIFGLPGETTLGLYRDWLKCNEIEHILTHDERAAAFMAEAYAKVTGRVGISEAPSPGGGHPVPGVIESFTGAVPTICFTSDVPFNNDKRNMLSGFDQNRLYSAITKESILISKAKDIPFLIRRAFRVALSGRPGAVHVRIPMDIYVEEAEVNDIFADPCMAKWPAYRPLADLSQIERALELLASAERPVIVCGQGALVSEAGDEVIALAEHFQIPVGCTMTAKGTVSEVHPLSIRLIGARGGTSYSNKFLETADLVFFVGSNTDSAGTDAWKLPSSCNTPKIIHLNIDGVDAGNNYRTDVVLLGDAKATVGYMAEKAKAAGLKGRAKIAAEVAPAMAALDESMKDPCDCCECPIHPIRFVKELEKLMPEKSYVVVEPSVGSIFSAAYMVQKKQGRMFLSNYSNGALGYSIPAAVGVAVAHPDHTVFALGGDGSFHFNCGELETYARLGVNVKLVIFNNNVFGWIKGETQHVYHSDFFATNFGVVDYAGVAKAFGIRSYKIDDPEKITDILRDAIEYKGPVLIEMRVPDETELVPPIPRWIENAKKAGIPYCY